MADEINKKDVEEIRNLRQAEAEITKELVSLRERLTTLSKADVLNLSEAANIQSRILTLEKEKQGIQSELVDLSGNVLQTDERRSKIAEEQTKRLIQQKETTGDILIKTEKLNASHKIESTYQKEFTAKATVIQKMREDEIKDNESINKAQKVYNDTVGDLQKLREKDEKSYVQLNDLAKRVLETTIAEVDNILDKDAAQKAAREGKFIELKTDREIYDLASSQYDLEESRKEILQKVREISTATDDRTREALTEELKLLQMKEGLLNREFLNLSAIVAEKQELNAINKKDADAQAKILEKTQNLKDTIDSTSIGHVFDGIEGQISKIPGGKALTKAFGFDKMKDSINKNLGDSFKNVVTGFQKGGTEGFKSIISGVQSFGKALLAGPQVVIFGMIAAVAMIVSMFGEADKAISEVQKTLGGSKAEAVKTYEAAQGMSKEMGIAGVNAQEVVKGMATASEIMGGLDIATQIKSGNKELEQFAKDATVLSEKFGMSADEIGNIKTLATLTGESMGSLVNKSQGLGKGLMTDKAAMKALASVPKEVSVAFKGGTESLIKASQKAKMLGMDLKKVQDIGDGMLDIESSLAKEMEARVLTGKNLQLDSARQLALTGDIAGLQDELLNQAGSLEEFQNMNRLQQKSMADAMGMSVEEMTEMLSKAQEYRDVGLDSSQIDKLQKKNAEELRKEAAATNDEAKKAYIEKLAAEKESATLQEKMESAMTKLKEQAMKIIAPLAEMASTLFDSLMAGDSLGNVMDIVGGAVKAIVPVIKVVFGIISAILKPLTSILGFFFQTEEKVDATGNKVTELKSGFMGVLGVVGAIGGLFAGKALLGKGLDMVKDKVMDAGGAIKDKLLGGLSKVGDKAKEAGKKMAKMGGDKAGEIGGKMKKAKMPGGKAAKGGGGFLDSLVEAFNKMDAKKMLMGAAALLVIAAALYVTAKAVQEFMKVDWAAMAKAGVALLGLAGIAYLLSKSSQEMIIGAAAMLILGGALYLIGAALKQFIDIKWEDLGKAAVALLGLIGVAALLGAFWPIFLIGAGVLAALGVALLVFATAMLVLGKAAKEVTPLFEATFTGIGNLVTTIGEQIVKIIDSIGNNVEKVVDKLMGITALDPSKLAGIALGIGLISVAILAFGSGSALGGIADGLGKMFGGDSPIDQLINLTEKLDGEKLLALSTGIMLIATTMKMMAESLGSIDTSKLDEFKESLVSLLESMGSSALMEGVGKLLGGDSPLSQINNLLDKLSPEKLSASAKSLLEVSSSLKNLADTISGMDIEKLGEVFEKINQDSGTSKTTKVMNSIVGGITSLFGGGEKEEEGGGGAVSPAISTVQQTATSASPVMAGGGGTGGAGAAGGISMSGVEGKLDKLIGVLTAAVSQPTIIKFGDRFIEEIKSTIDMKKSYQAENNYGRKV